MSEIRDFWERHQVLAENNKPILSAEASRKYIDERFEMYPMSRELLGLYGDHDNEIVLDYGCGPANDVIGFLLHTNAEKIIGMDISLKAIYMARKRIQLHDIDPHRWELTQVNEAPPHIPLEDKSVDFINCLGVIHHVSDPDGLIREFFRVLKPDGRLLLMHYSRMSIWFHLNVAYDQMILRGFHKGLTVDEAFSLSTDTKDCPKSACWNPHDFVKLLSKAGPIRKTLVDDGLFDGTYCGAYFCNAELNAYKRLYGKAIRDERLDLEHRTFLTDTHLGEDGYPRYYSKHAGFGAVFKIWGVKRGNW